MMTTTVKNILDTLRAKQVRISLNGEQLQVEAPKGVLDQQLQQQIRDNKEALIAYIRQIKGIQEITIAPVPVAASYPLSSPQRRLWILSLLEPGNTAYHIPVAYRFEGALQVTALEKALQQLIDRHEILRTVFREQEDGEPVQIVLPAAQSGFRLLQEDLRGSHYTEHDIRKQMNEVLMQPFNLTTDALLRVGLYRTGDQQWMLLAVIHHIISDAWSMHVLMQDLMQYYYAAADGAAAAPPALRIQYRDYAAWQQAQLQQGGFKDHKSYWLSQFEQGVPPLQLLGDLRRPAVKTYRGGIIRKEISARLTQGLKQLVHESGTTLYTGLLTVVQVLLSRYTSQREIVLGTLMAGREHIDLDNQIGFYVNTIALRLSIATEQGFRQQLERMKHFMTGVYKYQDYPFDELVKALDLTRDAGRHPLFDVLVVLQNMMPQTEATIAGKHNLQVMPCELPLTAATSKFDLSFYFAEQAEGLLLDIEFNSDIYLPATIQRMGNHLEILLEALLRDPDQAMAKADYLSKSEKTVLLERAAQGASLYFTAREALVMEEAGE
ncbi:condensation domain-containing protein [Chitinophaga solisilvae]|uniref:condensation domain-containing protein n=1 Tax=Chitinophaga solisilvae TaxID=1233460 RepID=UPI00136A6275|nr:condensation domain-containing protein [Chitinophaga solisilvae]